MTKKALFASNGPLRTQSFESLVSFLVLFNWVHFGAGNFYVPKLWTFCYKVYSWKRGMPLARLNKMLFIGFINSF